MYTNCLKYDCDQSVSRMSIHSIAPVHHIEALHSPVPSSSKIPDAGGSLIVVYFRPQTTIIFEETNILSNIARYISRKLPKKCVVNVRHV